MDHTLSYRKVPEWDEFTWNEEHGLAVFSREVELPNGNVELVEVFHDPHPTNPNHAFWRHRTPIIGTPVVHTDRTGHRLETRYTQGITDPIAYPNHPPMPKLIYWDRV